jgi:hypothetical protein
VVVRADRAGPVAQVGLQQHQGAITGLFQRLQLYPAPRSLYRTEHVTGPRPRGGEQITQVSALTVES